MSDKTKNPVFDELQRSMQCMELIKKFNNSTKFSALRTKISEAPVSKPAPRTKINKKALKK